MKPWHGKKYVRKISVATARRRVKREGATHERRHPGGMRRWVFLRSRGGHVEARFFIDGVLSARWAVVGADMLDRPTKLLRGKRR